VLVVLPPVVLPACEVAPLLPPGVAELPAVVASLPPPPPAVVELGLGGESEPAPQAAKAMLHDNNQGRDRNDSERTLDILTVLRWPTAL
jgi:hypothetical protein